MNAEASSLEQTRPLPKPRKRWGCLLLAVLIIAALYGLQRLATQRQLPPLPDPNGYDDLLAAGEMVQGSAPDWDTAPIEELRQFVDANMAAEARMLVGLERDSRVPVVLSQDYVNQTVEQSQSLRPLMRLTKIQAVLDEQLDRPADAVADYVTLMKLGIHIGRGGLMIHALTGVAAQSQGLHGLRGLVDQLSIDQCRELLAVLPQIAEQTESANDVIERERLFARTVQPWTMRLLTATRPNLLKPAEDQWTVAADRLVANRRLLEVHLALRCFMLEQGEYPKTLQVLLPTYLDRLPDDPFSGQPLVYKVQEDGYLLYSVGPDRQDNGGTPMVAGAGTAPPTGDLLLEPSVSEAASDTLPEDNSGPETQPGPEESPNEKPTE